MSIRGLATCARCAREAGKTGSTPFLVERKLSRLPARAILSAASLGQRYYSESAVVDATKARLGTAEDSPAISDTARRRLEPLAQAWETYTSLQNARLETQRQLRSLKDEEMRELFESEVSDLDEQISEILIQQLPSLLLPPESTDKLPVLLSINAGIGGDEATACTAILVRVYQRYAELNRWDIEIISQAEGATSKGSTGTKEMTMKITTKNGSEGGVYEKMRYEGGVHRFQRVPPNDAKGRVQTSTVAVIVLPVIPEGAETELVDPKDVKMEVMRSRGAGGQHVNKTESAVRLTHTPTGITVSMQDSRSQHQNRAWAWEILRSRLFERKQVQLQADRRNKRQEVISGTDRSDKIRSYKFPTDQVTDHRIGYSCNLQSVMDGHLDPLVDALTEDLKSQRLQDIIAGVSDEIDT